MNLLQRDGRRLHPRFQIDEIEELLHYSTPSNPNLASSVKVTEVAKDSITCKLSCDLLIPVGTEVALDFSGSGSEKSLNGKVASCAHQNGFTRIGILCSEENVLSSFPSSSPRPSIDKREAIRRKETLMETGKREFERRGLWPGLLSKRFFSHRVWEAQNKGFYFYMKPLQSATDSHVIIDGREMIMMSSNNYLGLSTHPKVKESAIAAIKKYGSGSGASAILGGRLDIHVQLEEALAQFESVEATCLFNSGFVTNVTTLITILQKGDAVFNDELNHASLLDGSRLSGAKFRVFHHRDMENLGSKLSNCNAPYKLVVMDCVFSMDGDIAPLKEVFRVSKKHGAAIMVDEAHAIGVFGKKGRGLLEHFGLQGKADVVIGTMSKSLGASGGFIAGNKELIRILKHTARGAVFTTSLSPIICAVTLTTLNLIDKEPERRLSLWRNAHHLCSGLRAMGFNTGNTQSPIIPVIFPTEHDTFEATRHLRSQDIFVNPVIYPAVKKHQTRVRLSVIASHTEEDIDRVLTAFKNIRSLVQMS